MVKEKIRVITKKNRYPVENLIDFRNLFYGLENKERIVSWIQVVDGTSDYSRSSFREAYQH